MNDRIRFDLNPPEMDYIFAHVAGETAKSGKYPERSWETDEQYTQMQHIRALKSHLYKYEMGIDVDPDSGIDTTEHMMWRAVAIAVNHMRKRVDDRPLRKQQTELVVLDEDGNTTDLTLTDEGVMQYNQQILNHYKPPIVGYRSQDVNPDERKMQYDKQVIESLIKNKKSKNDDPPDAA